MNRLALLGLAVLASPPDAAAQNKTLLFTGRFPFVSLDSGNERMGGSITQLQEFDISCVTPDASRPFFARTFWLPTTTYETMMGDAYADGNYSRFFGFKTYFERWNFAAPFVRAEDQANCTWDKVFWTVRDDAVNKNFTVLINNGTGTAVINKGDFFRFTKNGNVEYFITQQLIMKAAGPQPGSFQPGASAICQDAAGNLYYSPAERGNYASGNIGTPEYRNDGSVIMILRQDITYQRPTAPFGNVVDVVADSAFCIFDEVAGGPQGQPSIRTIMQNAGALDRNGTAITITNNMVGLALDPNGGTINASFPHGANMTYEVVPNLIWCDDGGGAAATIWSTAVNPANNQPGSIAVINGVQMGDTLAPATGAWLGVTLDVANFQPTLMGLAVIDQPADQPFLADAPKHGAIETTDTAVDFDFWNSTPGPVVALLSTGPATAGQVPLGIDAGFLLRADSFRCVYGLTSQFAALTLVSNPSGYATLRIPGLPLRGRPTGATFIVHGVAFTTTALGFKVSNPVIAHFR